MIVRVLIVDDHEVVRQGLRMFLKLDPEIEVIGEAPDGEEALRLTRELRPNVVLMDLLMPKMDGVTATAKIREEMPGVEVVAVTSVLQAGMVTKAIQAGATGYLLKSSKPRELRRAIIDAARGRVHLAPEAAARLVQKIRTPDNTEVLTDREAEVLKLLAQGKSNVQISFELTVVEQTVKAHVSSILRKLGAKSRTQAALHAVRTGLVSLDELTEGPW